MRIVVCANNRAGAEILAWLKKQGETIVGLVVHPPGRRKYGHEILSAANLPEERIWCGNALGDIEIIDEIRRLKPDIAISVFFGYIFRKPFLDLFPRGCINLHPAFLPYNRGAYPNVWSIVEGTPAGTTIHYVNEGIDSGKIISQKQIPVHLTDTGETLYHRLESASLELFKETWPEIVSGNIHPSWQNSREGTFHKVQDVESLDEIDPDRSYTANELINILRARTFPPYKGAYIVKDRKKIFLSLQLQEETDESKSDLRPCSTIGLGTRTLGTGYPVYIIAELSANHNQDFDQAVALVHAAKEAGADAVKIQTYTADTLTINCTNDYFRIGRGTQWEGKNLYDLYGEAYTPWDWQPKLEKIAHDIGLDFFSTPFDPTAVDFLEKMDVPAYKVASFEIVDIPLIRTIARTGKPIIMSTGMASIEEIEEAVEAIRGEGNDRIALLKCTSAYPALAEDMNLRTIPDMVAKFGVPVGLSDHTLGTTIPVAAIALGACIVEKHFTMSRKISGPDSSFSLEPQEFRAMVDAIRETETALGSVNYTVTEDEQASRVFRRSLFAVEDIVDGEVFTENNVRSIRPGNGLLPKHLHEILGKQANGEILRGTPLSWDRIR
jgi:pseudaminic acid synthase